MLIMADENFSEWLKKQLKKSGMSQSELARAAGVTRAAINGIVTGARGPGTDLCNGIAKALKLPPEEVHRAAGLLPPAPAENAIIQIWRVKPSASMVKCLVTTQPKHPQPASSFQNFTSHSLSNI